MAQKTSAPSFASLLGGGVKQGPDALSGGTEANGAPRPVSAPQSMVTQTIGGICYPWTLEEFQIVLSLPCGALLHWFSDSCPREYSIIYKAIEAFQYAWAGHASIDTNEHLLSKSELQNAAAVDYRDQYPELEITCIVRDISDINLNAKKFNAEITVMVDWCDHQLRENFHYNVDMSVQRFAWSSEFVEHREDLLFMPAIEIENLIPGSGEIEIVAGKEEPVIVGVVGLPHVTNSEAVVQGSQDVGAQSSPDPSSDIAAGGGPASAAAAIRADAAAVQSKCFSRRPCRAGIRSTRRDAVHGCRVHFCSRASSAWVRNRWACRHFRWTSSRSSSR